MEAASDLLCATVTRVLFDEVLLFCIIPLVQTLFNKFIITGIREL